MTTIMQPFQCDLPPLIQETHRTTHTGTTTRCRTQRRNQNDPSRTHRTHEVPFIAGCSHFTSKNARFRAPAASQNKVHATFMQPLHCVSQHHVANLHVSTHMATPDVTTIMQPFQCDLQPQIQETHRYTHTGTTTRCRTQRRNQNDPSRTRRTHEVPFNRRAAATYTEKHKVSCSGFLPKTKPHATFMQPLHCVSQHHVANLHVSTHMATL